MNRAGSPTTAGRPILSPAFRGNKWQKGGNPQPSTGPFIRSSMTRAASFDRNEPRAGCATKAGCPGLDFETWETTNPSGRVVPEMLGAPPSPRPSPPQRRRPVAGDPGFHPSDEDRSLGDPGLRLDSLFTRKSFFSLGGVSRGDI